MSRRPGVGAQRRPGFRGIGGGLGEPTYAVSGLSDANNYASAAGVGTATPGSERVVMLVMAVPAAVGIVVGVAGAAQSRQATCQGTFAGGGQAGISALWGVGGVNKTSALFPLAAGDVGRILVMHKTQDGVTGYAYVSGTPVDAGVALGGAVNAAAVGDKFYVGRHQYFAGFSAPAIGLIAYHATATVMTPAQIAADAVSIMSRSNHLAFPTLPGETARYHAVDLVADAASWHDRDGDDATLTRTGAVTLTEVT